MDAKRIIELSNQYTLLQSLADRAGELTVITPDVFSNFPAIKTSLTDAIHTELQKLKNQISEAIK